MATTAIPSRRLLARLQRDLAELREQPYPGVAVFTDDADMRKMCLVLTPPAGPWTGLSLHFDVKLSENWPADPPTVSSSVSNIDHPNLFGDWICCDLLKPAHELQHGYTGGYTPALTLRGLFLQSLTFFSATSIEQDYGGSIEIGDAMVATYMEEKDQRIEGMHMGYNGPKPERLVLERRWKADEREAAVVVEYDVPGCRVTHKVKDSQPHPNRIHLFEQRNRRWQSTLDLISRWTCRRCPYGSDEVPHQAKTAGGPLLHRQTSVSDTPAFGCHLHILNDDVLLEIASHMQSETLITFGRAYPRFHALISTHHIFLLRELQCFFLKTPLSESILGVGVALHPSSRTLTSDFDWLSLEAFKQHEVRLSIEKRPFEYFLPLAFNRAHFERAKRDIWAWVASIDKGMRQAMAMSQVRGDGQRPSRTPVPQVGPRAQPHQVFNVLFTMMNNVVVALMKSCDEALSTPRRRNHSSSSSPNLLNASEKAVISYCHLMHLLTCLCRSHPAILRDATARIWMFLASPENRTKEVTPDMGELIVVITLVLIMSPPNGSLSWSTLAGPFLEEAITRNVRWVLKDAPELEVMEEGASDYRLTTTFAKSRTSLRLIMFQATFLDLFIKTYRPLGIGALDRNYGFPEAGLPGRMVEEIKEVYRVSTWPEFFAKAKYQKSFSKARFTEMLREAVEKSAARGYHRRSREMGRLVRLRKELERARLEAQARVGRQ